MKITGISQNETVEEIIIEATEKELKELKLNSELTAEINGVIAILKCVAESKPEPKTPEKEDIAPKEEKVEKKEEKFERKEEEKDKKEIKVMPIGGSPADPNSPLSDKE